MQCAAAQAVFAAFLLIIRIENDPGTMGARAGRPSGPGGAFAGAEPDSAVMVST